MARVLIADKMSPLAAETFHRRGIDVDEKPGLDPHELAEIIGGYDGLAVRSATKVTEALLQHAAQLKVIGRAGIGVDNIDMAAATAHGMCVMNTPFGNSITTAEHAIAMMLALARQIPAADKSTQSGLWEKSRFMGMELYGKTLGIIGCGNIGAIVADRAQGLKMKVLAYDPFLSENRATDLGVEKLTLADLLARADIITLHTPLNDATRHIINSENLQAMKPGVRIVNCARGGLIDEQALCDALQSGHVAGAAVDVFSEEPARENPLFGLDNVIATPHLGAATEEAQVNVARQVAEQMADFLIDGAVTNALNMASVTAEEAPKLRPYFELARVLGSFAGQLTETAIKEVEIDYLGHVAALNVRPLTATLMEGLLRPLLSTVNMINAPIIARERGMQVRETMNEDGGGYRTMIRLTVVTERQRRTVAGTLFADDRPRIVAIKDIKLEAEVGPHMLYVTNEDKPGFIGALGSLLSDSGVNIATFHLGRKSRGGDAIALIEVDEPVERPVLEQVLTLPHVMQAKAIEF